MRNPFLLLPTVLIGLVFSACEHAERPELLTQRLNSVCDVSFRRGDALGAAGNLPVGVLTDSVNGASVTIGGTLIAVDSKGILLRDGQTTREHWIPLTAILRITFNSR